MTLSARVKSSFDGFELSALSLQPRGAPLGGVVVIQEIFGVTPHIADISTFFADAGYAVVAPSFYDRIEPGFHAGHDAEGMAKGIEAAKATPWAQVAADVQAAIDALPKPVFVTGFCWGGAATWAAAARCTNVRAASCFYGRLITTQLDTPPKAPTMLHYGARDAAIPMSDVEKVRAAAPIDSPLYIYDAGHGFCRKASTDYDATACDLALSRTLDWFARWRASGD